LIKEQHEKFYDPDDESETDWRRHFKSFLVQQSIYRMLPQQTRIDMHRHISRALYDVHNISDVGALLVIAQHLRLGEGDKGFSGNSACRVHVL
jgi:predicted ATPase